MIPVHVVTGFLGSGKTTLLRDVLARPEFRDSAVIVNEFGEVGLDHILLEEVEEGVVLLASGCICCTVREDLKATLARLEDRAAQGKIPRFARVILETTGLADPAPVASTLVADPMLRHRFRLGNIVCTVDAVAGPATLAREPEALKQVAVADRIVVTKCDLADPAPVEALLDRLNPVTERVRATGRGVDADLLFGEEAGNPARREAAISRVLARAAAAAGSRPEAAHGHEHDPGDAHHGPETRAFTLVEPAPIDWIAFGIWLSLLLHAHGTRILRVKGLLNVAESDTPVVLHGVQHVVHPPLHLARWPDTDRTSRIVFITRGLEEAPVRTSLAAFLGLARRLAGDPALHEKETLG